MLSHLVADLGVPPFQKPNLISPKSCTQYLILDPPLAYHTIVIPLLTQQGPPELGLKMASPLSNSQQ